MLKRLIQPWVARCFASTAWLRLRRATASLRNTVDGGKHGVLVFIRTDDPYSYLLLQVLGEFRSRFQVQLSFYVVSDLQRDMYPEPEKWRQNAITDARLLAGLYRLNFPERKTITASEEGKEGELIGRTRDVSEHLVMLQDAEDFIEQALVVLTAYWAGEKLEVHDSTRANTGRETAKIALIKNDQLLRQLGHYFSATLLYQGEWYWGLDRLDHLEHRLNDKSLSRTDNTVVYDLTSRHLCSPHRHRAERATTVPLEMYFSARSPYSYLGLEKAYAIAKHHGVELKIKLVLPMMMRGMNVPSAKKWYIFSDTAREARKVGLPYGFVADPLGLAVERCYALFDYARSQGKEAEYLLSFARAVNTQGINAESNGGMRLIVERAGLQWKVARGLLSNQDWREEVNGNYNELSELGLWGVPCFKFGSFVVWGQDRLEFIEQKICSATP